MISESEIHGESFKPVKMVEVELSQPLPVIPLFNKQGKGDYQKATILARLHSYPLGLLEMDFASGDIAPERLALQLWAAFGEQINKHLGEDGFSQVQNLPGSGLSIDAQPRCEAGRQSMLAAAPVASIIIATRDRAHSLATALNSILSLEYPQFEVILIDNAPKTSETFDYYADNEPRFARKNISLRYIREDVPGLAVAHNRGLEAISNPIVAFTDDDVIVDKYWLAELVRGFDAAPDVGCVTGLVIPMELNTPAQVLFEEFGGFTKGFMPRVFDLAQYRPDDPLFPYSAGKFGTGANMAFRTEFILKAGGFDPALGIGTPTLGADDMGAFFQAIRQGYQLVYQPSALIRHQHRRTYPELQRQMRGYGVGLTAFLMKCLVDEPKAIVDVVTKIPAGMRYAFAANSTRNRGKSTNYPPELERIERKGMLYGPLAYLYSRWQYRRQRKSFYRPAFDREPALARHFVVNALPGSCSRDE